MAERSMPWDEEAEVAVLGALTMGDEQAPAIVFELIDESMFYAERHRRVFMAAARLFDKGDPIEIVTLQSELSNSGELDTIGGLDFLTEIMDAVPTAANVRWHAATVRDRALRRRIIRAGTDVVQMGYAQDGRSAVEVMDNAARIIFDAGAKDTQGVYTIKQAMQPAFAQIERYQESQGGITGISTGLIDLDEMTGGWQRGNLIIIAGRPSMGKTAMVTGSVLAAALQGRVPTALFSLEMTKEEIVQRMLCSEAAVDLGRLLRGRLSDDDCVRLAQVAGHLNTAPIWIDDSSALTVMQVRAKARRLKAENPDLGMIVVDYLQLMTAEGENRTQEVSAISRGLKAIAKELNLPVIALSQLSRGPENRGDNRPRMADLRESGAIEQDADVIGFLYRAEKYEGPRDSKGNNLEGKAELIIAKQRNGPVGSIELYFRKECARFESLSKQMFAA